MERPSRRIRAHFDAETITVYQAYNSEIANSVVREQRFIEPSFKMERMTWIKPSFLWMMYRSGWATKKDQERILAIRIRITRTGFEWALKNGCLAHYNAERMNCSREEWQQRLASSPVRIQWDPERTIHLEALPLPSIRSIQIGLAGEAMAKYTGEWICGIEDITAKCKEIKAILDVGMEEEARGRLPREEEYSGLCDEIKQNIQWTH